MAAPGSKQQRAASVEPGGSVAAGQQQQTEGEAVEQRPRSRAQSDSPMAVGVAVAEPSQQLGLSPGAAALEEPAASGGLAAVVARSGGPSPSAAAAAAAAATPAPAATPALQLPGVGTPSAAAAPAAQRTMSAAAAEWQEDLTAAHELLAELEQLDPLAPGHRPQPHAASEEAQDALYEGVVRRGCSRSAQGWLGSGCSRSWACLRLRCC